MPWETESWTRLQAQVLDGIAVWLPNLLGALLLLVLGWVIGRVAQFSVAGVLRRLGVDKLAERAGIGDALAKAGWSASVSEVLARLVYWLILLVFLLAAVESLGLPGVTGTLGGLVSYLPHVLAAAVIVLIGSLLARVVGDAVGALAVQSGMTTGPVLGQLVRYVLVIFAVILAMEQLGVETTLLVTASIAVIAASALALALAFGLGNRELARNIMAGFHVREEFKPGQQLTVGRHRGRLLSIGPVKSVLETAEGQVSLPNAALIDEAVVVVLAEDSTE